MANRDLVWPRTDRELPLAQAFARHVEPLVLRPARGRLNRVFYVFLGGGVGSVARYLVTLAAARFIAPEFPFGTLIVNLLGCFLIGAVHEVAMMSARLSPEVRLFLTTGILGGFTTYSAFNYETLSFFEQGQAARAAGYGSAMILGCAAAGALGVWAARSIVGSV